jgi:hypothetical protein
MPDAIVPAPVAPTPRVSITDPPGSSFAAVVQNAVPPNVTRADAQRAHAALTTLLAQAGAAAPDVSAALFALKNKDGAALKAVMPALFKDAQGIAPLVGPAVNAVKSGATTSEFWLCAAVLAANIVYTGLTAAHGTAKFIPANVNEPLSVLGLGYAAVRGLLKKSPAQVVVAAPTPTPVAK